MVWDGRELKKKGEWIVTLTQDDITDIRAAIEATKTTSKSIGELSQKDFDFGNFNQRLTFLRNEVLDGQGFAVVRGLNGSEWSDDDLIRAYWGMGCSIGDPVSQNAQGHLLGHIIDQRLAPTPGLRVYQTNKPLSFHSDSCDIAGLLCLRTAKRGGESAIASSAAIHNSLLKTDPSALETLYGRFQCDRYGEIPQGKLSHYAINIFNEVQGKLICCGMDPDIRSAQRLGEVPPLSSHQQHALNQFQATAKSLALNMFLQRGDIQLVNNLTIVHARQQFEDYAELEKRRYLIRLWLSSSLGRELPDFMAERWGNIKVGTVRGGIQVPGVIPAVVLNPAN